VRLLLFPAFYRGPNSEHSNILANIGYSMLIASISVGFFNVM
jgi:hypothetical protein